jgi:hypothetical protein
MSHKHDNHHHHHHHDKNSDSSNSHSHELFKQVEITSEVEGHFDLIRPKIIDYFQGKYKHIKLQHAYAQKVGSHDWKYWAQFKAGDFGDQHDWTVVFEIKEHKVK